MVTRPWIWYRSALTPPPPESGVILKSGGERGEGGGASGGKRERGGGREYCHKTIDRETDTAGCFTAAVKPGPPVCCTTSSQHSSEFTVYKHFCKVYTVNYHKMLSISACTINEEKLDRTKISKIIFVQLPFYLAECDGGEWTWSILYMRWRIVDFHTDASSKGWEFFLLYIYIY
jgi:hypothetical protein